MPGSLLGSRHGGGNMVSVLGDLRVESRSHMLEYVSHCHTRNGR